MKKSYRIPLGIAHKELENELFLITPKTSEIHNLDDIGTKIFNLLIEGNSPEEIGELPIKEYDISKNILINDILELIENLITKGLLEQI